jgi:hypothetical protein
MRWAGHVAPTGQRRVRVCTVLMENPGRKTSPGTLRCIWEYNIRIDLTEIDNIGVDSIFMS